MAAPQVVFHGSQTEAADLVNAIARNCACVYGLMGVCTSTCASHDMLISDQRAMNGLVWMHRDAKRLRREEFSR
jgi:hypothetical protein